MVSNNSCRNESCPAVTLNNKEAAKYLGMHIDKKLNWKQHIEKQKKQINEKAEEFN